LRWSLLCSRSFSLARRSSRSLKPCKVIFANLGTFNLSFLLVSELVLCCLVLVLSYISGISRFLVVRVWPEPLLDVVPFCGCGLVLLDYGLLLLLGISQVLFFLRPRVLMANIVVPPEHTTFPR